MTTWSANSVSSAVTASLPPPPSIETGPLLAYCTWEPSRSGMATWFAASRQTIWQLGSLTSVQSPVVCASANARTSNASPPSPPSSRSGAWLAYTTNVSSPAPPSATSGWLAPVLSQPRVVATVAKTSFALTDCASRLRP